VPNSIEVFPGEANDQAAAADELLRNLDAAFIDSLDGSTQRVVLDPHGGLWEVLRTPELAQPVQKELQRRTRFAILSIMKSLDAARLFLQKNDKPSRVRNSLLRLVQSSAPAVGVNGARPHLVIAVPGGRAGETIEAITERIVPELQTSVIDSDGDVLVCQEVADLPIPKVAAALIAGNAAHIENAGRVLSRSDVEWTEMPVPTPD
jgi:hypothetical protein